MTNYLFTVSDQPSGGKPALRPWLEFFTDDSAMATNLWSECGAPGEGEGLGGLPDTEDPCGVPRGGLPRELQEEGLAGRPADGGRRTPGKRGRGDVSRNCNSWIR